MKPKLHRNTFEEEAAIQAGIAADPDNRAWTKEDWGTAVRVRNMTSAQLVTMIPPDAAEAELRRRGKQKAPTKEQIAIRLDRDLLEHLRAGGEGWQNRANALLRKAIGI